MSLLQTAAVFLGLAFAEQPRPVAEGPSREAAAPGRPERPLAERAEFPPQAEPSAPARARRATAGEPREPGRPDAPTVVDYGYDALRRVARVELLGTSRYEAFTYDRANNVTSLTRPGEGTWLYDRATFSEVPQRNRPGTQSFGIKVGLDDLTDTQQWEQGRLTSIASVIRGKRMDVKGGTVKPFLAKSTQTFGYDGAGRLVRSTVGTGVSTYGYDVDDAIVVETTTNGCRPCRQPTSGAV